MNTITLTIPLTPRDGLPGGDDLTAISTDGGQTFNLYGGDIALATSGRSNGVLQGWAYANFLPDAVMKEIFAELLGKLSVVSTNLER